MLRNNLGLATVNKHLDLEKAMKTIQWYKEATCKCHNHAVRRGGRSWQLRPAMVPREALLQLPTISDSIILQRRRARYQDMDEASTMAQASSASSVSSDGRDMIITPSGNEPPYLTEAEEQFNTKMKKPFENPTVQQLFPCDTMELLNQLCTQILAEAKKANAFKWVNFVQSARDEVFEIKFRKEEMEEDIDTMLSEFQKKLYTGLDVVDDEDDESYIPLAQWYSKRTGREC